MNRNIKSLLKSLSDNILSHLMAYILGAGGLGALLIGYFYSAGELIESLLKSTTTLSVLLIVGLLFFTLGYLLGKPKREKAKNKIIEKSLLELGDFKWNISFYSNGKFSVALIPYCPMHEMELYERDGWLYLCPLHNECNCQIRKKSILAAHAQAKSIISTLMKKNATHLPKSKDT